MAARLALHGVAPVAAPGGLRHRQAWRTGPWRAAAFAVALAALGGCSSAEQQVVEATLGVRIDALETEIKTRIGPAVCAFDSECRALPIGALACGGPSRFLAYSTVGTDEGALLRVADSHRQLSAQQLTQQQAVGPCIALATPTASCDRSRLSCTLR